MLTRADLLDPIAYNTLRPRILAEIAAHKRSRRVPLGEKMTLVFEDRRTVCFQIQEMIRLEPDLDEAGLRAILEAYGDQLPDGTSLHASLMVEVTESDRIKAELEALRGLDRHLWLMVDDTRIAAEFEDGHQNDRQIAALQFVTFPLPAAAREAFAHAEVRLVCDHPAYLREISLAPEIRAALAQDLSPTLRGA